jgi:hypothetical protein
VNVEGRMTKEAAKTATLSMDTLRYRRDREPAVCDRERPLCYEKA